MKGSVKLGRLRLAAAPAAALLLAATRAMAEEGMWPFDEAPLEQMRQSLGVELDAGWLDHLQSASVRLSSGCSGSVVSPRGLVLTNQHCIMGCARELSGPARDIVADGFLAAATDEELECPALQAEILVGIDDVTGAIFAAGKSKVGDQFVSARNAAIARAEARACRGDVRFRCQVIGFYDGGQFKLYKYRRYADVRLVFAPELEAAFFGGDPDNFTFPRHALDCAFLRLYEGMKPGATPRFLKWRPTPPRPGEPVFVSGSPGVTERGLTVAQLVSLRDVALPLAEAEEDDVAERLKTLAGQGPVARRAVSDALFTAGNDLKLIRGRQAVLRDPKFMAERGAQEARLEARLAADPTLAASIGDPWTEIQTAQTDYARRLVAWRELEADAGSGSSLFHYARELVRAAAERAKPPGERLPEYADSRLPLLQKTLLDASPVEPALERVFLEVWLSEVRARLGEGDPAVAQLLGTASPVSLAGDLVRGSRLDDPAVREALWRGGGPAVAASDDPMIRLALRIDALARAARQAWEDQVIGPEQAASERIERARFALDGPQIYPDATFSLRLSYGRVAGWTADGRDTAPTTTLGGLFARATDAPPYRLPLRWTSKKDVLDGTVVLDFSTTNDIIGGSSGSPVVDAAGRIIGTAFDGNSYAIAGDYAYDATLNRSVAVSTQAITEVLEKVYDGHALAQELGVEPAAGGREKDR
jgi:hypothetical protein